MKLSLFNIQNEFLQLSEALIENGGELTPEIETALELNKENLETKGTNYGLVCKQMDYNVSIIDAEIDRLNKLKKSINNSVDRLKNNLSVAMQLYQIEEIKTPIIKISFRKSESVEIINVAQLDQKFMVEKVTVTPDKTAIKTAIKSGEIVEGAIIKENKNLQIK